MKRQIRSIESLSIITVPSLILWAALGTNCPRSKPYLIAPGEKNAIVWSYPSEQGPRNFIDRFPYGSLDEVIMVRDGKVITFHGEDSGFQDQNNIFKENILNQYRLR
jgi:hypothetical protein